MNEHTDGGPCDLSSVELTEADVPAEGADWGEIVTFAMTFDEFDSFEETFEASDRVERAYERGLQLADCSLWDLRAYLLMEERGCHHRGDSPTPERMRIIYVVLDGIRDKLRSTQSRKALD